MIWHNLAQLFGIAFLFVISAAPLIAQTKTELSEIAEVFPLTVYFENLSWREKKGHLDYVASEMKNRKEDVLYVFGYLSEKDSGLECVNFSAVLGYLTRKKGISASRIKIEAGGVRKRRTFEFYLVTASSRSPKPSPSK